MTPILSTRPGADPRPDERLLRDYAARGDRAALEALVARRHAAALRFALRALGDPAAAQDAVQDALVALVRAAGDFEEGRPFGPWWGAILANAVRKAARGGARRARRERRAAAERAPAESPAPGRRLEAEEVAAHVRRLPPDLRVALLLNFYEGRSHAEVAEVLRLPPGTAKSRIRRGLERLRASLGAAGYAAALPGLEGLLRETEGAGTVAADLSAGPPPVAAIEASAMRRARAARLLRAVAAAAGVGLLVAVALLVARRETVLPRAAGREAPAAAASREAVLAGGASSLGPATGSSSAATLEMEAGPSSAAPPVETAGAPVPQDADPAAPAASLTITVLDRERRPVGGAEVAFAPATNAIWDEYVPELRWESASAVRTDAAGRARLGADLAAPGARGHAFARTGLAEGHTARVIAIAAAGGTEAEILLAPTTEPRPGRAVVTGRLTLAGVPLARTPLAVRASPGGGQGGIIGVDASVLTDEEGLFAVPDVAPGDFDFDFSAPGALPKRLALSVEAGEVLGRDIDLDPGATVAGRVLLPPDLSPAAVRVRALREADREEGSATGDVLPGGRYRVRGVPPGEVILQAEAPGHASVRVSWRAPGAGEVEGPELILGDGISIVGRLVHPDGAPIAGQRVELSEEREAIARTTSDARGRFRFDGVAPERATFRIAAVVGHRWAADRRVDVDGRDLDMGDLVASTARVVVRTVDAAGRPVPFAAVAISPDHDYREFPSTDADGRVVLEDVTFGEHSFSAVAGDLVSGAPVRAVVKDRGDVEVVVRLEAGGAIAGRVSAAPGRLEREGAARLVHVGVTRADRGDGGGKFAVRDTRVAPDGTYRLRGLAPGRYTAELACGGGGRRVIEVRAGEEARADFALDGATERVRVRVRGLPADASATASALWRSPDGAVELHDRAQFSGDVAELEHVEAGPAVVRVAVFRWETFGRCVLERPVVVSQGATLELELDFADAKPVER